MPAGATFHRLHETIQLVTNFQSGWGAEPYHFFDVEVDGLFITDNPVIQEEKVFNGLTVKSPSRLKIDAFLEKHGELHYCYDAGDNWCMKIELMDTVDDYYFGYPTILAGEGTAPPEDAGGPPGFAEFLRVYQNPNHPDYLSVYSWAEAQGYKPFDLQRTNEFLKRVKYKKTEWDQIDHENYAVRSDKYRESQFSNIEEIPNKGLLLDYITACTNLYGTVPFEQVLIIFNKQNSPHVTWNMMKALANDRKTAADLENRHVYVEGLKFVHEAIDYEDELKLFTETVGKPYYIPEKENLLLYTEDAYFERTPQLKKVEKLMKKDGFPPKMIKEEVKELALEFAVPFANTTAIFQTFIGRLELDSLKQIQSYAQAVMEAGNATRLWENRGHTPEELFQMEQPYLQPIPAEANAKTGRNEPCPCGSGKKYKKCCGKS